MKVLRHEERAISTAELIILSISLKIFNCGKCLLLEAQSCKTLNFCLTPRFHNEVLCTWHLPLTMYLYLYNVSVFEVFGDIVSLWCSFNANKYDLIQYVMSKQETS